MKSAIVLGMDQNGLGIVRSLGRKGIEVYGIDHRKNAIASFSRYCKKTYIFPNPELYPKEWFGQLLALGKNLGDRAVLLPTGDGYAAVVSKYSSDLSPYFLFNVPDNSLLQNIVIKSKQYKLAEKLGIPFPKTISPKDIHEYKEAALSYPVLIKGVSSHQWQSEFHNKGFIAYSRKELSEYFQLASQ